MSPRGIPNQPKAAPSLPAVPTPMSPPLQTPTVGRIVHFKPQAPAVEHLPAIITRTHASAHPGRPPMSGMAMQAMRAPEVGLVGLPDLEPDEVDLTVFAPTGTYHVGAATQGSGRGHWDWPPRA